MQRIFTLIKKSIRYLKHFGIKAFFKKARVYIKDRMLKNRDNISYQEFVKKEQKSLSSRNVSKIKKDIDGFRYKPLISIIIPTYKTPIKFLKEAIDSVQKQFYDNFEIIIYDDASKSIEIDNYFKSIQIQNLQVFYNKKNSGISETSNNAVAESKGEYLVFLDHDDTLSPNALYEIVKALNKNRVDYIYSDEDKLSKSGSRSTGSREDPFFKPDFSYDMLLGCMYITHIRAIRKSTFLKLHGLDKNYDGAQDWDFALRLYEHKGSFYHIPKILYHWRKTDQSTANDQSGAKSYAYKRQKELLEAHLKRSNIEAEVKEGYWQGSYKIDYKIEGSIQGEPKVSIIIPFRDQVKYLKTCVDSIKEKTTYKNYKIILVNNQSVEPETLDYLKNLKSAQAQERDGIEILNYDRPFNYSLINNFAVKKTDSDFIIFLNNDTKIITPTWIEEMLQIAQRKDVGAVGGLLLYKDDTVQHGGIIVGLGGVAAHSHRGFDGASNGHAGLLTLTRDVSAVTAACMMIERSKFLKVKGFDERLRVAYNDVDLCLRLGKIGLKSIYTPYMKIYHYETKTRKKTKGENVIDTGIFIKKWKYFLKKGDPFYNPNFTLSKEDYSFRRV
ncbi:MAG: glycosyltransferase family 2 protein [Patescibacteria group bacterium]